MGVKILLILFKKSIHISQDIFMQLQLPGQFIGRKAHPISRHGLMVLLRASQRRHDSATHGWTLGSMMPSSMNLL